MFARLHLSPSPGVKRRKNPARFGESGGPFGDARALRSIPGWERNGASLNGA